MDFNTSILVELHGISNGIQRMALNSDKPSPFWDTQWFSVIVGAVIALLVTQLNEYFKKRNERLDTIYHSIVQKLWFSPVTLYHSASTTQYGGSQHDKDLGEKMVIELKRNFKYWKYPISPVRYYFHTYEKALQSIPDHRRVPNVTITESEGYKKAQVIYEKIVALAKRKSGETEYTIRD